MRLVVALLALACGSGCVSQPAWVASPASAACSDIASKECLSEILVQNAIGPAVSAQARDAVIRDARLTLASIGVSEPQSLIEFMDSQEKWMCALPEDALWQAAEAVEMARAGRLPAAVKAIAALPDGAGKRFAMQKTTALAAKVNDQESLGGMLVLLSHDDKQAYIEGLQARLLNLLSIGDLERASSLQAELLNGLPAGKEGGLAAAQIAISYVVTGHTDDANAFLRKAAARNPDAASDDVRRLLNMMIAASQGTYPPPQDFFEFSSDAVRLQAHMEMVIFYARIGQTDFSRRIAGDMARLAEKRSFRGEVGVSNAAFSKLLIEAF